jgi:hypothetical protein
MRLGRVVVLGSLSSVVIALWVWAASPPKDTMRLGWDPPAVEQEETGWTLYRREGHTGDWAVVAHLEVTTWTFTDTAVRKRTTYCYVITAVAPGEESDVSNEACGVAS